MTPEQRAAARERLDALGDHTRAERDLYAALDYIEALEKQLAEAKAAVWVWQGDGLDELETLTCPVLIRPEALLSMLKRAEAIATALEQQRDDLLKVPAASLDEVCELFDQTEPEIQRMIVARYAGLLIEAREQRDDLLAACKAWDSAAPSAENPIPADGLFGPDGRMAQMRAAAGMIRAAIANAEEKP